MHAVWNGQLLTFRCPGTSFTSCLPDSFFHSESSGFSVDFFHSVISRMTWKAEVSDSAVQSTTVLRSRAHPDNRKMKVKNFSALCAERLSLGPMCSGHATPKYLAPALPSTYLWEFNAFFSVCTLCFAPLVFQPISSFWRICIGEGSSSPWDKWCM